MQIVYSSGCLVDRTTEAGRYLTDWRMEIARTRLLDSTDAVSVIASGPGYQSEAAFCRAFKRTFDMTPIGLRRAGSSP